MLTAAHGELNRTLADEKRFAALFARGSVTAREHDAAEAAYSGAKVKIVETPPGPPVLETVVAEIYGPPAAEYAQLISYGSQLRLIFDRTSGLVDTDDFSVARQPHLQFILDREKSALHGISTTDVAQSLAPMLGGDAVNTVHTETERDPPAPHSTYRGSRDARFRRNHAGPDLFRALRGRSSSASSLRPHSP